MLLFSSEDDTRFEVISVRSLLGYCLCMTKQPNDLRVSHGRPAASVRAFRQLQKIILTKVGKARRVLAQYLTAVCKKCGGLQFSEARSNAKAIAINSGSLKGPAIKDSPIGKSEIAPIGTVICG